MHVVVLEDICGHQASEQSDQWERDADVGEFSQAQIEEQQHVFSQRRVFGRFVGRFRFDGGHNLLLLLLSSVAAGASGNKILIKMRTPVEEKTNMTFFYYSRLVQKCEI